MKLKTIYTALLFLMLGAGNLWAQYTFFEPEGSFAIEVSMNNTDLKRLPIYQNSISSLKVVGDMIVGGTTANEGLSPYIFTASIKDRKMIDFKDLQELIPGQKAIKTGFSKGSDNSLIAGTLGNADEDGHLIKVKIDSDGAIDITDLGVPIEGQGILTLLNDQDKTRLYGISYPKGDFFVYDLNSGKVKTYEYTAPEKKQLNVLKEYALTPEDYLTKALIQDDNGIVYGSMAVNKIFAFNPKDETFEIVESEMPEVWGRRTLGQIESWAKSKDGKLFAGNSGDGQLFELDPSTKKAKNLGKPIMMNKMKALVFARDGKLYGIAGGLPGYAHLFSYDPNGKGFEDMGNPQFTMKAPGIEQGITWRGFQLGAMACSEDGKYIVMGEDESLSQLLVFPVEE